MELSYQFTSSITEGEMLEGSLKPNKLKLVEAWIEIHKDEIIADWQLASNGQEIFKTDPLKLRYL